MTENEEAALAMLKEGRKFEEIKAHTGVPVERLIALRSLEDKA